jgi:hypothetical protein
MSLARLARMGITDPDSIRLAMSPTPGDVWIHRPTGSVVFVDEVTDTEVAGWTEGGTRTPGRFRIGRGIYERWVAA